MSNSPFQSNNKGLTKRWAAWQPRPANGSGPRPVSLKDFDPDATPFMDGEKAQGKEDVQALAIELDALQNLLYADRRYKLQPRQAIGWRQGFGILFDDLVAAACTLRLLALWIRLWNW